MSHPMLTKRDYLRGEAYNKILAACKVEPLNYILLSECLSPASPETIKNHCETLMLEGYLTCEVKRLGKFKRLSNFYTTVKDHYSMDDMIPSSVKIKATMTANGTTYNNNGGKQNQEDEKAPAHIRTVNFENNSAEAIALREKYKLQSQLNRVAMKSKKNYVSGSILSSAI